MFTIICKDHYGNSWEHAQVESFDRAVEEADKVCYEEEQKLPSFDIDWDMYYMGYTREEAEERNYDSYIGEVDIAEDGKVVEGRAREKEHWSFWRE